MREECAVLARYEAAAEVFMRKIPGPLFFANAMGRAKMAERELPVRGQFHKMSDLQDEMRD